MLTDNDIIIKRGDATEMQRATEISISRFGDDWQIVFAQSGTVTLADGTSLPRRLPSISVLLSQLTGKSLVVGGVAYSAELAAALIKAAYVGLATGTLSPTPITAP